MSFHKDVELLGGHVAVGRAMVRIGTEHVCLGTERDGLNDEGKALLAKVKKPVAKKPVAKKPRAKPKTSTKK